MPAKKPVRIRRVGTTKDAQRELWRAVIAARNVLLDGETDAHTTLKAVHAIQQAISTYVRIQETLELEARLEALENRILTTTNTYHARA